MKRIENAIVAGFAIAVLATAAVNAHAQGKEYKVDNLVCYAGTVNSLTTAKEAPGGSYHLAGVIRSATPDNPMDGAAIECFGVFDVIGGVAENSERCVIVDRDGDRAWGRGTISQGKSFFEYTGGSGKYAGLTGRAERKSTNVKTPTRAGALQGCSQAVGSIQLK